MRIVLISLIFLFTTNLYAQNDIQIEKAYKENGKILVTFGAKWCGACQQLKKVLTTNKFEKLTTIYYNVDNTKDKEIYEKYNKILNRKSNSIPLSILLLPRKTKQDFDVGIIKSYEGSMTKQELDNWIKSD